MKLRTEQRSRLVAFPLLLVVTLASMVGGHSSAAEPLGPGCPAGCPTSGRIVYRPASPPFFRPKQFYLSNYAGASYPPLLRRDSIAPTSARVRTGRPFGHWFGDAAAAH